LQGGGLEGTERDYLDTHPDFNPFSQSRDRSTSPCTMAVSHGRMDASRASPLIRDCVQPIP